MVLARATTAGGRAATAARTTGSVRATKEPQTHACSGNKRTFIITVVIGITIIIGIVIIVVAVVVMVVVVVVRVVVVVFVC
jgi:uncharacterized membrane protein